MKTADSSCVIPCSLVDLFKCFEQYTAFRIRLEEGDSSGSAKLHGIVSLNKVIGINVV